MPLARHDNAAFATIDAALNFYSHASCEAWHMVYKNKRKTANISTHMPLARHDYMSNQPHDCINNFYSHASCEAWPLLSFGICNPFNFYSHASCEAWQSRRLLKRLRCWISTHMPLARHDWSRDSLKIHKHISTHMPLARHDGFFQNIQPSHEISTHMPLARHDLDAPGSGQGGEDFYSHASCEAWLVEMVTSSKKTMISTHMPLARHDITFMQTA